MSAIGVGDWIECIDASGANGGGLFDGGFLVERRVYQVAELSFVDGRVPSVRLVGQPALHSDSGRKGSYALSRFRPIYRPKSSIIEALKQPSPELEDA